jgi:hypothetical protein
MKLVMPLALEALKIKIQTCTRRQTVMPLALETLKIKIQTCTRRQTLRMGL